jgi:hypothetical protein
MFIVEGSEGVELLFGFSYGCPKDFMKLVLHYSGGTVIVGVRLTFHFGLGLYIVPKDIGEKSNQNQRLEFHVFLIYTR